MRTLLLLVGACAAFQDVGAFTPASKLVRPPCRRLPAAIGMKAESINPMLLQRRSFMTASVGAASLTIVPGGQANAVGSGAVVADTAAVLVDPPLEYLVPIVQYRGSISALARGLMEPSKWPAVKKRLDQIQSDPLSGAQFFKGLCVQYASKIKYDETMSTPATRKADFDERVKYASSFVDALRGLSEAIAAGINEGAAEPTELMVSQLKTASLSLDLFLARVSPSELRKAEALLDAMMKADTDPRNGRVEGAELETLSAADAAVVARMNAFF